MSVNIVCYSLWLYYSHNDSCWVSDFPHIFKADILSYHSYNVDEPISPDSKDFFLLQAEII